MAFFFNQINSLNAIFAFNKINLPESVLNFKFISKKLLFTCKYTVTRITFVCIFECPQFQLVAFPFQMSIQVLFFEANFVLVELFVSNYVLSMYLTVYIQFCTYTIYTEVDVITP